MSDRHPERPPSPAATPRPAQRTGYDAVGPGNRTPNESIGALAAGLLGFVFCPFVASTVAIVLGVKGRREAEWNPERGGGGLATAGLVLGVVGLVAWTVYVVLALTGAT